MLAMPTFTTLTQKQRDENDFFFALSEHSRRAILRALTTGRKTVGELTASAGLPRGSLSKHVAILKRVGLIATEREGARVHCSLANTTVKKDSLTLTHPSGLKVTLPLEG